MSLPLANSTTSQLDLSWTSEIKLLSCLPIKNQLVTCLLRLHRSSVRLSIAFDTCWRSVICSPSSNWTHSLKPAGGPNMKRRSFFSYNTMIIFPTYSIFILLNETGKCNKLAFFCPSNWKFKLLANSGTKWGSIRNFEIIRKVYFLICLLHVIPINFQIAFAQIL